MKAIFWTGYCNGERMISIREVEKIVNTHGYITDFKLFSDISISIKIEIEELNINPLYEDLNKFMSLDGFESIDSISTVERVIFLNMTFTKGTGNLRLEIPASLG